MDGWVRGINPGSRQRNKCDILRLLLFSHPSLQINWEYSAQRERRRHQNVDAEWRKKSCGTVGKHEAAEHLEPPEGNGTSPIVSPVMRVRASEDWYRYPFQQACPAWVHPTPQGGREPLFLIWLIKLPLLATLTLWVSPLPLPFRWNAAMPFKVLSLTFLKWEATPPSLAYAGVWKLFWKPPSVSSALI